MLPLYVDEFWLRTGFAVCAAVIGAVGLNLLVGTTGLLSLGHAFFLAVGAITYVYVAGEEGGTATKISGLGWPPLVAMLLGVLMAGLCGLLFSPIAARLRGIYLGVASLGLVFIGQHVLNTWTSVTGGFNGRVTPEFSIFGFHFASDNPEFMVLDVPYGPAERLWYLGLVLAGATIWFARNLLRSRPGRALQTLRDSEVAAAVMGVNVQGYKARVFLVSSMLGGLSGVLYALSIGAVAPESFSLLLSVQFLAMIVLGGLGSVWGAAVGAAFVSALPLVFQEYADSLPYIAEPGSPGDRGEPGGRLPLRPRDRPRGALRARRTRRPRPKSSQRVSPQFRGTRHPRTPVGQLTTPRGVQPMKTKHPRLVALVVIAMCLFGAGCGTKGSGGEGSSSGGVKTERGIEGNTITLGALTDLTGVFAALGKDITNAQALYWKNQNAGDKVCGKYDVKLEVKDHGYVTQQGVQLYGSIHDDVLAIEQTIGSPINTALAPQLESDKMVNIPAAWAQSLTENPENAIVGATYEIEMINVLDYLLKEGKIKEGDKIGHIYFEGEYGEGGLQGSKYFADKHDMTIVESEIKATDTDMTAPVTKLKSQGVNALALTVAPGQTASAAGVAASQGLDVPIAGNNPVFAPALLDGPSGPTLEKNLVVASPVSSFDKNPELLKEYTAKHPGDPTLGVVFGTAAATVMNKILDKACEDGDLTPEGVSKAKEDIGDIDTGRSCGAAEVRDRQVAEPEELHLRAGQGARWCEVADRSLRGRGRRRVHAGRLASERARSLPGPPAGRPPAGPGRGRARD